MKAYSRHVVAVAWFGVLLIPVACLWAGTYEVRVAPSTVKVMIQGGAQNPPWPYECTIADHYDLYLARGEHEAMQVVVVATDALTNAHVAVSAPQEVHGAGPLNGEANAWLVGHVDVWDRTGYKVDYPDYMTGYRGWYPDPLLTFTNTCNINAGDRVAFWIDVSTLRETTAGDYVATITVTADDSPTTTLQLNVHVWDFELPINPSLPTSFSCNETLTNDIGGSKYVYGPDWVTKGIKQKFYDMLLARRIGVTHVYQTNYENSGAESFDAITDWAARGDRAVCLKGLGSPNPANLNKVTDSVLATLVSQVRGAGLLGMSYIYGYDESTAGAFSAMHDMFAQVHTSYPGLRTMTTAKDTSCGLSDETAFLWPVVDIWVPQTNDYSQETANTLRARAKAEGSNKDVWWYICTGPWHPCANFFIEYPAIEARLLMGLMAYKFQTGGFFYYNIAKWVSVAHQPGGYITSGPYTTWDPRSGWDTSKTPPVANNGDGSLFCAGADGPLPTIRLENIRDGLEDYEYLKLLGDMVTTMQAGGPTAQELAWISSAQQLLTVPSNLVDSVASYTRDPATLESYREQLAAAILTGKNLSLGLLAPADHDYDGDVDKSDFSSFRDCWTGSQVHQTDPACWWADLDNDGDVDQCDFAIFQRCYSGEDNPADPHCAE